MSGLLLTWWIEKAVGDVLVCPVIGARLTEGWWHSVVRLHAVGKCVWQRRHFYLKKDHLRVTINMCMRGSDR